MYHVVALKPCKRALGLMPKADVENMAEWIAVEVSRVPGRRP
jgi:hypothetical protein